MKSGPAPIPVSLQDTPAEAGALTPPHSIFFGPLGLRAGWGIALYLTLTLLLASLFFLGLFGATGQGKAHRQEQAQHHAEQARAARDHQPAPIAQTEVLEVSLAEAAEAGAVLLAAFILARLEHRRTGVYGLPARHLRDLIPGALWGIAAIALLVAVLRLAHLLAFDRRLLQGRTILQYGSAWLLTFLLVGLFEEFFFRGYVQFTLMRGLLQLGERLQPAHVRRTAFWIAAFLLSTLFAAVHLGNAGEDPMGIVMVFVAGLLFSYALWKTGSLWWGVGFHMTWDWGQSFLFGVPDSGTLSAGRLWMTHPQGSHWLSGGVAGPEGSLLVLPVLLGVALVLHLRPQAVQPPVTPTSLPGYTEPVPLRTIS